MTESEQITQRCADTAAWLATVRVSQDGWAEVLERVTRDLSDLAAAMESGKIISHISDYRQYIANSAYLAIPAGGSRICAR